MVIFILNFLAVLLLASRGLGQVQLSPPSLAVLHGAQARFNCSTAAPWVVMSWFLNDRVVITVSAKHGTLSNSVSFTVTNRTTARSTAWELVIWNVTRNHTGDVTCDFQNSPAKMCNWRTIHAQLEQTDQLIIQKRTDYRQPMIQKRTDYRQPMIQKRTDYRQPMIQKRTDHRQPIIQKRSFLQGQLCGPPMELLTVMAGTVVIDGGNVTGRKGGRVRFRCQASGWYPAPTVTWALAVNQEVNNYTTSHAAAPDGLFLSTSTLDVLAVVDTWVQCQASVPALPAPKTHRVFLTVGPGGDDQTVLIAVVVSVLTIPLLVLLIIALICCCVNERKSRRTEDTRGNGRRGEVATDRAGQGQNNLGYSWNENTGVAPSELRSDRGPPISVGAHQAPDSSGQGVYPGDFKTIRHATTV
ncbi:immunoglobulin superfamily member 5 [Anguilla anguilla]|uniref:immunoglobulin superfamily member 5 n=1 Tax=Anguilla anguilla TaxID=7936 RepID=UPI0015A84C02|nr:immunoglobulin superfamily member 5 [Anguilla anguilla]